MVTELTTAPQSALARITTTSRDGLISLTRQMGDPRAYRAPESLRATLRRIGTDDEVRAALAELSAEQPKAMPRDFAIYLGKLSLHYWRPDFTPEQAKHFNADFVSDLDGVTVAELANACAAWRRNAANRFFPRPGELLVLIRDDKIERQRRRAGAERLLAFMDGSPEAIEPPKHGPRDFGSVLAGLERARPPAPAMPSTAREEAPETRQELRELAERRKAEAHT